MMVALDNFNKEDGEGKMKAVIKDTVPMMDKAPPPFHTSTADCKGPQQVSVVYKQHHTEAMSCFHVAIKGISIII